MFYYILYFGILFCFPLAQQSLAGQGFLIFEVSPSHSFRHTTLGRTPLGEWSAQRSDFYRATHNIRDDLCSRETIIHAPRGFRTRNPSKQAPQIHALDRSASGIGQDYT